MGVLVFFPQMGLKIDAVDGNEKLPPKIYQSRQWHPTTNFK